MNEPVESAEFNIMDAVSEGAVNGGATENGADYDIRSDLTTTDDISVDIGPIAESMPAHEVFPSDPEPPLLESTTGHISMTIRDPIKYHEGGHSCSECIRGGGDKSSRAKVGGVDYSVGGWGQYEIDRRHAKWETKSERPGRAYGGRSYIGGGDVVNSVPINSPLKRAAEHLASALGKMQDALCDPAGDAIWECSRNGTISVPALTSEDVNEFIRSPETWSDPDTLAALVADADVVADTIDEFKSPLPSLKSNLPPMPARVVQTDDDIAVIKLEAAMMPYISGLEKYQAAVATRFDEIATAIDKKFGKGS